MSKPGTYVDSDLPRDEAAMIYKRCYTEEVIDDAAAHPETGGTGPSAKAIVVLAVTAVVLIALAVVASLLWPDPWFIGWTGGPQ